MLLFKKETIKDEGRIKIEKAVISEPYPVHKHEFIELVYIMAGSHRFSQMPNEYYTRRFSYEDNLKRRIP